MDFADKAVPLRRLKGLVPDTLWMANEVGDTEGSKKALMEMFPEREGTSATRQSPFGFWSAFSDFGVAPDALILDSFAGSGTTAHAVLKANAKDGTRRFILVEGEDYADTLTAERVRRAIHGYAWSGTQRETLLEEKITLTQFKEGRRVAGQSGCDQAGRGLGDDDGSQPSLDPATPPKRKRFDKIEAKIDEGVLRGGRAPRERAGAGAGRRLHLLHAWRARHRRGPALGQPPAQPRALRAWLFYTATGATLPAAPVGAPALPGRGAGQACLAALPPDLAWLKSPAAALTLSVAEASTPGARRATPSSARPQGSPRVRPGQVPQPPPAQGPWRGLRGPTVLRCSGGLEHG